MRSLTCLLPALLLCGPHVQQAAAGDPQLGDAADAVGDAVEDAGDAIAETAEEFDENVIQPILEGLFGEDLTGEASAAYKALVEELRAGAATFDDAVVQEAINRVREAGHTLDEGVTQKFIEEVKARNEEILQGALDELAKAGKEATKLVRAFHGEVRLTLNRIDRAGRWVDAEVTQPVLYEVEKLVEEGVESGMGKVEVTLSVPGDFFRRLPDNPVEAVRGLTADLDPTAPEAPLRKVASNWLLDPFQAVDWAKAATVGTKPEIITPNTPAGYRGPTVVYVNGIMTSRQSGRATAQMIADHLGCQVEFFHNPTHGVAGDAMEALMNWTGNPIGVNERLRTRLAGREKVNVIAHSQGNLHVQAILISQLTRGPEANRHVKWIQMGSPTLRKLGLRTGGQEYLKVGYDIVPNIAGLDGIDSSFEQHSVEGYVEKYLAVREIAYTMLW